MSERPIRWDDLHVSEAHQLYLDQVPAGETVYVPYKGVQFGPGYHWAIIPWGNTEVGPNDPTGFCEDRTAALAEAQEAWLRLNRPKVADAWEIAYGLTPEEAERIHRKVVGE